MQRLRPLAQRRRSGYQDRFDLDDRLGAAVGGRILGALEHGVTVAVPAIHARIEASASMASALPRRRLVVRSGRSMQSHNPAEQQVVMELLQQKPLRANPVERLQQRGQHELLGRHRWTAFCGTQCAESGVQSIKVLIRQPSDPPGRTTGRDPLLDRDLGEQGAAALLLTSHHDWGSCSNFEEVAGFFSKLLSSTQHLPSLRHDHRHHYS